MKQAMLILLMWGVSQWVQAAGLVELARDTLSTHPDVAAAQSALAAANAVKQQREAAFKPQLTFAGDLRQSWMKQDFTRTALSLTGTVTLWQPAAQARIDAATLQLQDKKAQLRQMQQRLLQTLISAWSQWQLDAELRRSWQAEKRVLQAMRAQAAQLYQVGRMSLAELNLLDARVAAIDSQIAQLDGQMAMQQAIIEALSGHSVQLHSTPVALQNLALPAETLIDQAPQLAALKARVAAAQARAREAAERWKGRLQLYAAGVNNDSGGRFYDDMRGASVGLRFEAPLYTGGADDAATQQARLQTRGLRQQMDSVRRLLQQQLKQAAAQLAAARTRVSALAQALQANRLSEEALSADLRAGRASLISVLESARAREQLVRQQATARWQGWRAVMTVWAQWGLLTPEKLAEAL